MISRTAPSCDAARLAAMVRALAYLAHRVITGPGAADEARVLSAALAELQERERGRLTGELAIWLEKLRRRVDGLAA